MDRVGKTMEFVLSVLSVSGGRRVRIHVPITVLERASQQMENVIHVFMEHGDVLAMKLVWVNIVNIVIRRQDNAKSVGTAIGT